MASEKILNQKKEEVTKLANKIKESKLVLLTDYRGINVEDVTGLRAELRKANAEYLTNDYANAKLDYQRLLSINSRSVEAYIGLSRIAVIDKNLALANEYADNAVALAPSEADVYIRRA